MKVMIVFIVLLVLCGGALGGYMLFKNQEPISKNALSSTDSSTTAGSSGSSNPGTGEILELRGELGLLREKHEHRIGRLEAEIGQQAKEITQLKKQLAAAAGGVESEIPGETTGAPTSTPGTKLTLEGADRETLKQLLGELSEERRRDELRQREERMREELALARQRQVDSLAEKYKWDEQKKQQILDILAQQGEKINELREASRRDDASRESREQLQTQMRQVRDETQKALEGLLTEEELQELQRATRPARRERGTGRRNRFPSGRQPGENGR